MSMLGRIAAYWHYHIRGPSKGPRVIARQASGATYGEYPGTPGRPIDRNGWPITLPVRDKTHPHYGVE